MICTVQYHLKVPVQLKHGVHQGLFLTPKWSNFYQSLLIVEDVLGLEELFLNCLHFDPSRLSLHRLETEHNRSLMILSKLDAQCAFTYDPPSHQVLVVTHTVASDWAGQVLH